MTTTEVYNTIDTRQNDNTADFESINFENKLTNRISENGGGEGDVIKRVVVPLSPLKTFWFAFKISLLNY